MFLPCCCFPGVVQDCDEAPLLSDTETVGLRAKGTVKLLWPWHGAQEHLSQIDF